MKVVKKTAEYTVYQKRSGRYAVKSADNQAINEADKVTILLAEGLIKAAETKAPVVEESEKEAVEAEVATEEGAAEEAAPAEESAEESKTEEGS
ncbi:MAG: hypothetical protein COC20_05395 [Cellvibrionales bacterium]|nr:MAG: hypothetical protein COC20_05395 [Cellvibrionales bacterium]